VRAAVGANQDPVPKQQVKGEPRWPMAVAVLLTGLMRVTLPSQLRIRDVKGLMLVVLLVLVAVLMIGDPGRIDRQKTWLRVMTGTLIGLITLANGGSSIRLVAAIYNEEPFTSNAHLLLSAGAVIWLTNAIAFGLWYWDLDRGGAAARANGLNYTPAFVFPEMTNPELVRAGWYPSFIDYLHLSFNTALAFSPTDVSAIKPWAKLMMISEQLISLVIGILVVARAVNLLR
jgi:hypothetical protein